MVDFGVDEFFSFVIAEYDFAFVPRDDVVWIEGDLAASAGSIEDVLWKGVAAGVTSKVFDEVESCLDGGA